MSTAPMGTELSDIVKTMKQNRSVGLHAPKNVTTMQMA